MIPPPQKSIEFMFCSYWWFIPFSLYFGSCGEALSLIFTVIVDHGVLVLLSSDSLCLYVANWEDKSYVAVTTLNALSFAPGS